MLSSNRKYKVILTSDCLWSIKKSNSVKKNRTQKMRKLTQLYTAKECMSVYPQNSYIEILIPNVMITGSGVSGVWLDITRWILMKGTVTLIEETLRSLPPLQPHEDTQKKRTFYELENLLVPWFLISKRLQENFHSEHFISNFKMLLHLL